LAKRGITVDSWLQRIRTGILCIRISLEDGSQIYDMEIYVNVRRRGA